MHKQHEICSVSLFSIYIEKGNRANARSELYIEVTKSTIEVMVES